MSKVINGPLAFSTGADLVSASSRLVVKTKRESILNVEVFNFSSSHSTTKSPILLFIPGVCESAETISVQNIVAEAKRRNVIVAVLELIGHGLSLGKRSVCPSFDILLDDVLDFARNVTSSFSSLADIYFLSGYSLGGVLALYAANVIARDGTIINSTCQFAGVIPIAPAVGLDKRAIPPFIITQALSLLAYFAPNSQIPLTPFEDPSHYNCPQDTERNFKGHWPLSTSKMLLDLTSYRVSKDLNEDKLTLMDVNNVLIIAGKTDHAVPLEEIKKCHERLMPKKKTLVIVPRVGHDLLFAQASSAFVCKTIFDFVQPKASS